MPRAQQTKNPKDPFDLVEAPAPEQPEQEVPAPVPSPVPDAPKSMPELRQALQRAANDAVQDAERRVKRFYSNVISENQVELSLAPSYQAFFGKIMTVGLNGITIYFPVNGRSYKVPRSFASVIQGRRRAADDYLMRRARMANVSDNKETYTGELKFY